jgi:hypothetical protein
MFSQFGFSILKVFICYSYCQKMALVCEFQHTPLWKLMIFQGSTPCVGMRFSGNVPNSPRNETLKRKILVYLKSGFFWTPKDCCPPWARAKRLFLQL